MTVNQTQAMPPRRISGSSRPLPKALALGALLPWFPPALAGAQEGTGLSNLTLEQLSQIKIVTAARREQVVERVPAAVGVVTHDDIQRSGATSIPEALRNVPGLNVAQINSSTWGIGARGFPWQYAPRMLVLMDGRSVYTPAFGGVFWDVQDYLLEDLDRMEVVLGPGSTVWGANAMNGVINVISKSARDTQGTLVSAGGGSEKTALAGAREGFKLGDEVYGRVYAKYNYTDPTRLPGGASAEDAFQSGQAGFRLDGYRTERTHWTLQGDAYGGWEQSRLTLPDLTAPPSYSAYHDRASRMDGANVLGRWEQTLSEASALTLQAYYDYASRDTSLVRFDAQTADLEARHTLSLWERNKLDVGIDYRLVADRFEKRFFNTAPAKATTHLVSGFVQDELWLVKDALSLTAGLKLEQNSYTGVEPQPGARFFWQPHQAHALWAGYSRPVRLPSRLEEDGVIDVRTYPPGVFDPLLPGVFRVRGSHDIEAETLDAYEAGWRWQAGSRVSFETRGFYYDYARLLMISPTATYAQTDPVPAAVLEGRYNNGLSGRSYGGEVSVSVLPLERWRLRASYSYVEIHLRTSLADPVDFVGDERTTPNHTVALTSSVSLNRHWDLDLALRYVDEIGYYSIPAYFELDARLAWHPTKHWEVALVGQNLLQAHHPEYRPALTGTPTEIERGVYAKATWRF